MGPGLTTAISLASTAAGTGMGVISAIRQSRAQQAQAEYQADAARRNQELSEQQASAQRREGYDDMVAKRQETAKLIGRQRAAAGASGAAVDVGSNLDLQADAAARGELDAINIYNKSLDSAYQSELQAWNYGQSAAGYDAQADAAKSSGWANAATTALGGIAQMGSTWGDYLKIADDDAGSGTFHNYKLEGHDTPRMTQTQWGKLEDRYFNRKK